MAYVPQVSTAYYPEDAGWASRPDGENLLVLSIPQFNNLITVDVESYDYAWLYGQELDAYIFCFKINNKFEEGIMFKKEHAGFLLQEDVANRPFTIAITYKELDALTEKDPVLLLNHIELSRSEIAGW